MHQLTADFEKDKFSFLKNPIIAEFLGLPSNPVYSETKLETVIINHLQSFIMELGKGYAFVARQQHIKTDMGDFYIDLVFYNIILKCYLIIDLKTPQITHQDVGQMDMYIRMYDELKKEEGNNPTIGLLLCADTNLREEVENYRMPSNKQPRMNPSPADHYLSNVALFNHHFLSTTITIFDDSHTLMGFVYTPAINGIT